MSSKEFLQAAKDGNVKRLIELLNMDQDINAVSPDGRSALYNAITSENVEAVSLLIMRGIDVNRGFVKFTALMQAAYQGSPAIVKLLLDNKAKIDTINEHDQTALSLAACAAYPIPGSAFQNANYPAVIKLLLERGADYTVTDSDGKTPLTRLLENKSKPPGIIKECIKLIKVKMDEDQKSRPKPKM